MKGIHLYGILIPTIFIFSLVVNSTVRISRDNLPTRTQTPAYKTELHSANELSMEDPTGTAGPVLPQDDLLDAATRNWLKSLDGTRKEVALLLIETVAESGAKITAVGSWVNKASYADPLKGGTSDHDMRLVMTGATESEAAAKWESVRAKLIGKVRARFPSQAGTVLKSINLYPPEVILDGITEPGDALQKLNSLHMNPNLGDGPIEGSWGIGGKVGRDAYERTNGRAFWAAVDANGNPKVSSGFADLIPYGESEGIYTIGGSANIASQTVDKVDDALKKYDARTFHKQLERLQKTMKKGRDLGRLGKTTYTEALLKQLEECCQFKDTDGVLKYDYTKMKTFLIEPGNRQTVDTVLRRAKLEAELLRKYAYSTHPRDIALFANMLEEGTGRWARVKNALSEASAHVPWGPLLTAFAVYMVYIQTKDISGNLGSGEQEKVFRGLLADAAFVASIPAGILSLIVNSILEDAKEAGYILVTRYQDCEDMIAGIYEVKGREQVSEQKKIETNINTLATTFTEPDEIFPIVALHARNAAARDNTGKVTEKVDAKIEEELNKKCGPVIVDRWQKRRMEIIADAVEKVRLVADEIDASNAAGVSTPEPAALEKGVATVETRANFTVNGASVSKKIQDFINTIKPLGGMKKLVAVGVRTSYRWTKNDVQFAFDERDYNPALPVFDQSLARKMLTFDAAGIYSAKLEFVIEVSVNTIASDVLAAKKLFEMTMVKTIPFSISVVEEGKPTPTPTPTSTPTPGPTPTPLPTPEQISKLEFAGTVPGIWDGGNNAQGFDLARQHAKTKTPGECQWEADVHSEIWGRINPSFAPRTAGEIAAKIKDLEEDAKRWGFTIKARNYAIGDFKGQFVDSSIKFSRGTGSAMGFTNDGVQAYGRGWVIKGRNVVEVGYNAGGGGCWTNVDRGFLEGHTAAAQSEAIGIVNSLALVEKGEFKKVSYTGPKLDGSDMPKVTLSPPSLEKLKVGETAKVTVMVENAKAEDSPFKYNWGGVFDGKPETSRDMATITIKAAKPGNFPLSVSVEGQKYFLGSASLEYEVADYKAVIKQDKPTAKKVAVGTPVTFSAQLLSSGAPVTGSYIYRWQPTPEVEFNPIEGAKNTTTATFSRPGVTKVWVQVLEKKGTVLTTLAESDQIEVEAVNPELSIKFTPEKVFIGQEVKARVEVTPAELKEIDLRWEISANGRQTMESQDKREVTFIPQNAEPVTVTVRARVPFKGDDLGEKSGSIKAEKYDVKVNVLGVEGPKPQIWQEGVGLVPLEKGIAVHQFVGMRAEVTPAVQGARYEWSINEDTHFESNNLSQQIRLSRSQVGSGEASVIVRDKNGLELGRGSNSFSVTVSQADLDNAKERSKPTPTPTLKPTPTPKPTPIVQPGNSAAAHVKQGDGLYENGNYQQASDAYTQAIAADVSSAAAYAGRCLAKRGLNDATAAADCDRALQLDPNNAAAYRGRSMIKRANNDFQGAVADATRSIDLDPAYYRSYLTRGLAKDNLKDYVGALADYSRSIELNPGYAAAYSYRGLAQLNLNDNSGALADLDHFISINQTSSSAYNNRGLAKERLGDLPGAIADYEKAIALDPKNETAKRNLARVKPGKDRLGSEWTVTEAGIPGRWVRRGSSNVWDATWNNGAVAELTITLTGDKVKVIRTDTGGNVRCTAIYEGTLSSDDTIQGTETATCPGYFANRVQNWQGRIVSKTSVVPVATPTPKPNVTTLNIRAGLYRTPAYAITYELSAITAGSMKVRQWPTSTSEPPAPGGQYYNVGTATLLGDGITWRTRNRDVEGYCCGNNVEFEFQFLSPTSFKGIRYRLWPLGSPSPGPNDSWQAQPPDEFRLVGAVSVTNGNVPSPTPKPVVTQPVASEGVIFKNTNIGGVYNGPTAETQFTISAPHMITYLFTYHWNDARGATRPGTISLRRSDGAILGPWPTAGSPGQGGVPNANWEAHPNTVIPAGRYTIVDSSPSTWAQNSESGGRGHAIVKGYAVPGTTSAVPTPTPVKTPPVSAQGRYVTAIFENRSNEAVHIFAEGETFGPGNKLGAGEKREVRIFMTATGRIKFTSGRNGQVIATKFWDGDPSDMNRFPRVIFEGSQLLIMTGLR